MLLALDKVECVAGCGSGTSDSVPLIFGVIGLLVALISATLAWRAMIASKKSAEAADASLEIAQEQHAAFMAEHRAHATLELRFGVVDYPDNVVKTSSSRIKLVWTIGIRNVGDKPATHVAVHCIASTETEELKWDSAREDSLGTQKSGPWGSEETITDSEGAPHRVHFLVKIVDRLSIRGSWRWSNASAHVVVPSNVGEELKIPILITAVSDDLARDRPQERLETEIAVRRVR